VALVSIWGMKTRSVSQILERHVKLELECMDRLYLNGYVPSLQTGGGISHFFGIHRGRPVVSPALMEQMRKEWTWRSKAWLAQERIPPGAF
jgi:hypothetical protein